LLREVLRQFQVMAKNLGNPLASEIPQNKPQLEGSESPAQRQAVVGEIHGAILLGSLKVWRCFFQR